MGRSALLLVFGLSVAFGIIGISIRGNTTELVRAQAGYFQYSQARNLSRLAIHRHLRYLEGIPPGTSNPPAAPVYPTQVPLFGGSYVVHADSSGDTLNIRSIGTFGDSSYTMRVKLLLTPKPFPPSTGAVGMAASPADITFDGNPIVDGRNHDSTGALLTGAGDLPGITAMNAADSAEIASSGGTHIVGNPPVVVNTNVTDPSPFMAEYIASAEYVYATGGTISGPQTFGSSTRPTIVVCNPNNTPGYSIKFSGKVTGYGILAVSGDVQFSGGFEWFGLVIAFGMDNTVEMLTTTGNAQVVGGVILAGNAGAQLVLKGTGSGGGKVLYSSQALDKAKRIPQLLFYSILDWYE